MLISVSHADVADIHVVVAGAGLGDVAGDARGGSGPLGIDRILLQGERGEDIVLFDLRENVGGPSGSDADLRAHREAAVGAFEAVQRETDLLEIVLAGAAGGGFAHLLHGRQEQADEHRDNRDHDEQFNERKRGSRRGEPCCTILQGYLTIAKFFSQPPRGTSTLSGVECGSEYCGGI